MTTSAKGASELSTYERDVLKLLTENNALLKENNRILQESNRILQADTEVLIRLDDNIRRIKVNTSS
jgi:hypothetical protein